VGSKAFEVNRKVGGSASENDWKGGKLSKLTRKKKEGIWTQRQHNE
jgi:hypothetical protein